MAVARGRDTGASTHGCDDNTTGGVSMPTDSLRPALRWGDTALQARAAGEARLQSLLGAMASTHSEAEWIDFGTGRQRMVLERAHNAPSFAAYV